MQINWPEKILLNFGLIVICTASGPFGTFTEMALGGRFVYWVFAIIGCGFFLNAGWIIAFESPHLARLAPIWRFLIGLTVSAPLAGMLILGLELVLRNSQTRPSLYPEVTGFVWLMGLVVGLMEYRRVIWPGTPRRDLAQPQPQPPEPAVPKTEPAASPAGPVVPQAAAHAAFFDRLAPGLGRDLVSLSIRDHYLEVVTAAGRDMLHMRMSDAVSELRGYDGLQVHRSHWIATDAMVRLKRRGSSHFVMLTDGRNIPVSRPHVEKVRNLMATRPRRVT